MVNGNYQRYSRHRRRRRVRKESSSSSGSSVAIFPSRLASHFSYDRSLRAGLTSILNASPIKATPHQPKTQIGQKYPPPEKSQIKTKTPANEPKPDRCSSILRR